MQFAYDKFFDARTMKKDHVYGSFHFFSSKMVTELGTCRVGLVSKNLN